MGEMSLKSLRAELPEWHWSAERSGLGWRYRGSLGERRVLVRAQAVLCGPVEDDFSTQWVAEEGGASRNYAAFWLSEQVKSDG